MSITEQSKFESLWFEFYEAYETNIRRAHMRGNPYLVKTAEFKTNLFLMVDILGNEICATEDFSFGEAFESAIENRFFESITAYAQTVSHQQR